jgi:hypothetical protein
VIEKYKLRYDSDYIHAEDYGLWVHISKYTQLTNIPEVLFIYRFHSKQVSYQFNNLQKQSANLARLLQLKELGIPFTREEGELHKAIFSGHYKYNKEFMEKAESWFLKLSKLHNMNVKNKLNLFNLTLARYFFSILNAPDKPGWSVYQTFFQSHFIKYLKLNTKQRLIFTVKCLLKKGKIKPEPISNHKTQQGDRNES